MAKHTPGPWRIENASLNGATNYLVAGKDGVLIAMITEGSGLGEQASANLKLIEAAPDMLTLLREIQKVLSAREWSPDTLDSIYSLMTYGGYAIPVTEAEG